MGLVSTISNFVRGKDDAPYEFNHDRAADRALVSRESEILDERDASRKSLDEVEGRQKRQQPCDTAKDGECRRCHCRGLQVCRVRPSFTEDELRAATERHSNALKSVSEVKSAKYRLYAYTDDTEIIQGRETLLHERRQIGVRRVDRKRDIEGVERDIARLEKNVNTLAIAVEIAYEPASRREAEINLQNEYSRLEAVQRDHARLTADEQVDVDREAAINAELAELRQRACLV